MILIVVILTLSLIIIQVNREQIQIFYTCLLIIFFSTALFGCTEYIREQFSDVLINNLKSQNEIQMNNWVYKSTYNFLLQYKSQSKFSIIRLLCLQSAVAIFYLGYNIIFKTQYICLDDENDNYNWCGTTYENESQYSNDHNQTKNLQESEKNDYCSNKIEIQGPVLILLGILCQIVSLIFIIYEILSIIQWIYLRFTLGSWPSYQQDTQNINIPQTIIQTKVFSIILFIYYFAKFIGLLWMRILGLTELQVILIISSYCYYFVIQISLIGLFFQFVFDYKVDNKLQYNDYQIYIDSILRMNYCEIRVFKFLLTICFIFTIIGMSLSQIQIDTSSDEIINLDLIIYYECGITQLIQLGLILIKYIIIPYFTDRNSRYLAQIHQEVQTQNVERLQINIQQQLSQERTNYIFININDQNNIPQYRSQLPILYINKNFIFKVKPKEQTDCAICLEKLIQNSNENPIIQLNCHISHIFHQQCIECWLIKFKKCPLCKAEFSL
ncbi:unnamed protein product [Paramecium sonneborni]|uniref:RING-type domain-containing protein n=1 Tax=Paramecium sonneborni TaxID=65129 RepID=A0A8S1L095_9CILI|nr:unnamed protein product [Paramecium sonneborni]